MSVPRVVRHRTRFEGLTPDEIISIRVKESVRALASHVAVDQELIERIRQQEIERLARESISGIGGGVRS
jgi:hypothetical protein